MKQITDDKYQISYDADCATVRFEGALLLNGAPAYEPILQLLQEAAGSKCPSA